MNPQNILILTGPAWKVFATLRACKGIRGSFFRKTITVVCSWCGKGMGTKDGEGQSGTSHGICPECMKEVMP